MKAEESDDRAANMPRRPGRHAAREGWPAPSKIKVPPPARSGKTMHHPATRIGEIKHGKS